MSNPTEIWHSESAPGLTGQETQIDECAAGDHACRYEEI